MIPWKTYKGRRKISLEATLKENNLTDYSQVVSFFNSKFVEPPNKEEFEAALKLVAPNDTESVKETPKTAGTRSKTSRASTRKPTTSKTRSKTRAKTPDVDPEKVWQDGVDGSYSADASSKKKPPARKKPTARKQPASQKKKS